MLCQPIYKWTEAKGKEVYLKPSGYTDSAKRGGFMGSNGLALSNGGELLICQHGDRRIAKMNAPLTAPNTNYFTVVGEHEGKRLNSPNDLFLTANGYIILRTHHMVSKDRAIRKSKSLTRFLQNNKAGQVHFVGRFSFTANGIGIFPDGKIDGIGFRPGKNNGMCTI